MKIRLARSGFTLIEILVVIVVIAVLAGMVAPNVFKHVGEAKSVTARSQIEMLGAALDAYRLDNGRYPATDQGLGALWQVLLVEPRPAGGPYLPQPSAMRARSCGREPSGARHRCARALRDSPRSDRGVSPPRRLRRTT
jgi:prepilin-type N-terminal cleavage/methylation domain-containing protein